MKNFLLNLILLSVFLPSMYGQTNPSEGLSTDLKMTVKKYEVIQTEIRTADNLLVYANTDMVFIGEKMDNIDLEELKKPAEASPKIPANQFLQVNRPKKLNRPNYESIIYIGNNNRKTTPNVVLNGEQKMYRDKKLNVGYPSDRPTNNYTNLATLSLPENRSITDLPGYVPVASYGLKLR